MIKNFQLKAIDEISEIMLDMSQKNIMHRDIKSINFLQIGNIPIIDFILN